MNGRGKGSRIIYRQSPAVSSLNSSFIIHISSFLRVGSEWRRRQSRAVGEIRRRVVGPAVAHRDRLRHRVAPDQDGLAINLRIGPDELAVRAGDSESLHWPAVNGAQALGVREAQTQLVAFDGK